MEALRFAKYEGLGNDFVVVDDVPVSPGEAVAICDRHLGVGADGVLMVSVREGTPAMRVINADGSVPEMCGNGVRCVAWHLVRTGRLEAREVTLDTDAGPHRCRVVGDGRVEVEMAVPSLEPERLPLAAGAPMIDAPFTVGGAALRVTAVSMGNPHVVTFDEVRDARRRELGPLIERDPLFPNRVNAGFARVRPDGGIDLAVHERGAGWTRACGTGACAAAVAAVETGRAPRGEPIAVWLPGGLLEIGVGAPGEPVRMTGPARHVFDGTLGMRAEPGR